MTSKKRNASPAQGPTSKKPNGNNEDMAIQLVTPEPTSVHESPPGYFSGMSLQMAIQVATGRWYPGRGDVSGGAATVPKPTIKAVAKEPEPEHEEEEEEEDDEDDEEEKAHEPQICQRGVCRQTYTGVDGAADLVNHISEDHVGHDDEYNPRCDFGSCDWTRKDRRDLLMAHVIRHIDDYKPIKCDQCNYRTKELRELTRHKKRRNHQ